MRSSLVASSILAGLAASVNAISTISIKGSKFFTSDGDQFYIKGSPAALLALPTFVLTDPLQALHTSWSPMTRSSTTPSVSSTPV